MVTVLLYKLLKYETVYLDTTTFKFHYITLLKLIGKSNCTSIVLLIHWQVNIAIKTEKGAYHVGVSPRHFV